MVAIIPETFARVEPPLIYDSNWRQFISPSMVTDKRENVPLTRAKEPIFRYFFSTKCKISNYIKLILVRAISDEVA